MKNELLLFQTLRQLIPVRVLEDGTRVGLPYYIPLVMELDRVIGELGREEMLEGMIAEGGTQ
jgi:hypothetical protein